jgi:hypothetical protein
LRGQSIVEFKGSTFGLHLILPCSSLGEESGILGVAVKCVDIERNTNGESKTLDMC